MLLRAAAAPSVGPDRVRKDCGDREGQDEGKNGLHVDMNRISATTKPASFTSRIAARTAVCYSFPTRFEIRLAGTS